MRIQQVKDAFVLKKGALLFWGIVVVNVLIRLVHIDLPLLEGAATRQGLNLMVAKTYFEEGMRFLYPQIYINGDSLYYSALEIQFIPYIVALFYKMLGGIYPIFFRLVSILFTVLSLMVLFRWAKKLSNERTALIAIFVFGFSPISIYLGRSAHFEMPMLFFNMVTLYAFHVWTQTGKIGAWSIWSLSLFMAASLKIPTLYLLLPMSFLAYQQWGWRFIQRVPLALPAVILSVISQMWLHHLRVLGPHEHWIHYDVLYNVKSMVLTLSSIEFYKKLYLDMLHYVLTPIGLTLAILGISGLRCRGDVSVMGYWLGAVAFFFAVLPETIWVHSYYHIHYLPIAAFMIASGAVGLWEKMGTKPLVVLGLFFSLLSARYAVPFYWVPENKENIPAVAHQVQKVVPKEALIIASSDSPAAFLYYTHRRGWAIDFSDKGEQAMQLLDDTVAKGAQYVAHIQPKGNVSNDAFTAYLRKHFHVVYEDDASLIVQLKAR